ncbi:hypothetical protein IY40_14670 [Serratia marcescens]|uniref:hypothetical protein n=1 Tax=Serratia marcescens TaxID=615 RepID=UPI0004E65401|nr:hypothetical protein [Serratia marcescens]KFF78352.1 hypothetical protein IY40_14670 [Serratia marcescens]
MRFKFIAIVALLTMLAGVVGIYSDKGNEDEEKTNNLIVNKSLIYYTAKHNIDVGAIVTTDDFAEKEIKYPPGSPPAWLDTIFGEKDFRGLMASGGVAYQNIASGERASKDNLGNLLQKIDSSYSILPISVTTASLKNPNIADFGFIDLFLVSNDNKAYRDDLYQKSRSDNGTTGKDYKDTRVKQFASKVWFFMGNGNLNKLQKFDQSGLVSSLMKTTSGENSLANEVHSNRAVSDDKSSTTIVYAYFKPEDVDKVIQAQIMGMFFITPTKVHNINEGIAKINNSTREITPSDIVSGAPISERQSRVVEIRGAQSEIRKY